MAAEEGENSPLSRLGEAVVRRMIQAILESLASAGPRPIPAAIQSQIIRGCYQVCSDFLSHSFGAPNVGLVSMDDASRLILDTLLILGDERPLPPEQLCIGLWPTDNCGQQITRIPNPIWTPPLRRLDIMVALTQPAGPICVVTAISMFPVIRGYNHPRLCAKHEEMMELMLNIVLLSTAFLDWASPLPQN